MPNSLQACKNVAKEFFHIRVSMGGDIEGMAQNLAAAAGEKSKRVCLIHISFFFCCGQLKIWQIYDFTDLKTQVLETA